MNGNAPAFMDYKKVYDYFLGDVNREEAFVENSNDTDLENGIMQKRVLDNTWYEVPFVLTAAGYYEVGDRHRTNRSNGDFFELIDTVSGHGIINVDDQTIDCTANTILLINCSIPHSFRVKRGETWEYKHIHFTADGAAKNVAEHAKLTLVNDLDTINPYFDQVLIALHHISADTHFLLSNYISAILTEIIKYQFKSSFTDPQEELVKRAVDYIHNHYMEKINIKQMAEDEFISPYHFIRLFKKYHGVPPYNYLMDYRLKKARYFFMQGKFVKEVAKECGFSSTNSFSRAFQKRYGMVPSEYRENVVTQQIDPSVDFTSIGNGENNENEI